MIAWKLRVMLLVLAALPVAAENLLPNGDFADGLEHWQIRFPEENETKYARNHEWVSLRQIDDGPVVHFVLSPKVAASEGVKAVSELVAIEHVAGKRYAFGAETFSTKPGVILFIEGYQRDPERQEAGDNQFPGFVRVYRATIHVKAAKNQWSSESRVIALPKLERYRPTHLAVKLYAFHPAGEAMFRHVFLRPVDE